MGKLKFIFTNIFLWIAIVASALLFENVGFLTNNPSGRLSDQYFFMIFGVAILCYILTYVFEHKLNKTKVDFLLLTLFGILLVSGSLAIWLFKDTVFSNGHGSSVLVSFTFMEKLRMSMTFGLFILTLYSIFFIFSKNHISPRSLWWLYVIVILITWVTVVYSFATEINSYRELFIEENFKVDIHSVFWNTNMFSGTLLMGMCASMVLNIYKKNPLSYISMIAFYIEILITCSVLSVIIGTAIIFGYFLVEIIYSFKKHPRRSFIFLALYLSISVAIICLFAAALDDKLGYVSKFFIHVYREGLSINVETFSNRKEIWTNAFILTSKDPLTLTLGYGFGISPIIIKSYTGVVSSISSTHNGALQILMNYGLVGASIYTLFLLYFLFAIIRMFKKHFRFSLIFLFVGLAMLGYSIGESVIFFNSNVQGLLVGTLFYLPVLMRYKAERRPNLIRDIKLVPYSTKSLEDRPLIKTVSSIFISVLVVGLPFLFMKRITSQVFYYHIYLTAYICVAVCFLFVPYLVYLWHKDTSLKFFRLRALINTLIMATIFGVILFFFYFFKLDKNNVFMYLYPITLASLLVLEVLYYSLIARGKIRLFFATFTSLFKDHIIGAIVTLALSIPLLLTYQSALDGGLLKYIVIVTVGFVLYFGINVLFWFKDTKTSVTYLNNVEVNYLQRCILKDEINGN